MNPADILRTLEAIAPEELAFSFDKVGLQIGDRNAEVTSAVVALDHSNAAIDFAIQSGAQLLLTHHPIFFDKKDRLVSFDYEGAQAIRLIQNGIALISAHTNWDSAIGGVNDALAKKLDLQEVEPYGYGVENERFKCIIYVPKEHALTVLDACYEAGAGSIGKYDRCSYQSDGIGTFRPLLDANPSIGKVGEDTVVSELRLEIQVPNRARAAVESAIRSTHPYEEPVVHFLSLGKAVTLNSGRVGRLPSTLTLNEFLEFLEQRLVTRLWCFGRRESVSTVALTGGAADGDWSHAKKAGADVFLTGEIKQHVGLEASESGICAIAAGHYATEQPGVEALADVMRLHHAEVNWTVFTPEPGQGGRPIIC
jgi:dinuclear metal center YbgI/SA1388 family protein